MTQSLVFSERDGSSIDFDIDPSTGALTVEIDVLGYSELTYELTKEQARQLAQFLWRVSE